MQVIEYDTILDECRKHVNKIKKVKEFLLMCVHRKRFGKKIFGSMMIQAYMRGYIVRKDVLRENR